MVGHGCCGKAFLGQIASPDNCLVSRDAEVECTFHGRHLRWHGLSRSSDSREIENERQTCCVQTDEVDIRGCLDGIRRRRGGVEEKAVRKRVVVRVCAVV